MLQSWRKLYAKSENTQAYSLLSPALILVAVAMLVPMMLMLSFSFFTQVSMMEIDFSFTFQRYIDFFQKNLLVTLLIKSVKISFLVTLITLITGIPSLLLHRFLCQKEQNAMACSINFTLLDLLFIKSFFLENYIRDERSYKLFIN
jgi:spermidine/putrescine transport system permease protein